MKRATGLCSGLTKPKMIVGWRQRVILQKEAVMSKHIHINDLVGWTPEAAKVLCSKYGPGPFIVTRIIPVVHIEQSMPTFYFWLFLRRRKKGNFYSSELPGAFSIDWVIKIRER